jgi:DNA-binding transcriptional ArsR family regulator
MPAPTSADAIVSRIAAAVGAPARVKMLYSLADGRARTCTELAMIADLTPSTASVHLQRLRTQRLVTMTAEGKHHYYRLAGATVAGVLEALSVLAEGLGATPVSGPTTRLRAVRTCYDHIAGVLGVALCNRFRALGWLSVSTAGSNTDYDVSAGGARAFGALGIDIEATRSRRRRFAYACADWTERKPHLGGALAAAFLEVALRRKWVRREPEGRALVVTGIGHREFTARFGVPPAELVAARSV